MAIYRPRGTLARVIHAKFHNDNSLDSIDTRSGTHWLTRCLPGFSRNLWPLSNRIAPQCTGWNEPNYCRLTYGCIYGTH
ncbi:GL10918 [Drosophila persimilis]|uniref:GL10918 n=1 Tax=Drosophila persimilis TaxID=7234 RepID=B4GCY4_DROPE|nr:GL10918 [Drosophila persimilis]